MTRVVFYVGVADRFRFLSRLLQTKILAAGRTALLAVDESRLAQLDDALWQERGFLPHCRLDSDAAADTPIALSSSPPPECAADVLISLLAEAPAYAGRFPTYIDIVGAEAAALERGRLRYRHFIDRGYRVEHHRIGG